MTTETKETSALSELSIGDCILCSNLLQADADRHMGLADKYPEDATLLKSRAIDRQRMSKIFKDEVARRDSIIRSAAKKNG